LAACNRIELSPFRQQRDGFQDRLSTIDPTRQKLILHDSRRYIPLSGLHSKPLPGFTDC